jgi:hypothetical protein
MGFLVGKETLVLQDTMPTTLGAEDGCRVGWVELTGGTVAVVADVSFDVVV